jgi:phage I-like protein
VPWEIRRDHPDCSGYAVVKKGTGKLTGCHPTKEAALRQLAALYAQEGSSAMDRNPKSLTTHVVTGETTDVSADQIGQDGRSWIEVEPVVTKDRNGPWYFTNTEDDLETLAQFLRENPERIPVDRDHATDTGGTSRAAGWFTGEAKVVKVGETTPYEEVAQQTSLWAEVAWTPAALQEIRDGEFRFISPVTRYANKDKKSGLLTKAIEIIRATLTNNPHYTQLAPVRATDDPYFIDDARLNALYAKHGEEQAKSWLAAATAPEDSPARALARAAIESLHVPTPDDEGDVMSDFKAFATALGLSEDADENAITAAIAAYAAKASKADALETKLSELVAREAKNVEVRKALGIAEDADDATTLAAIRELQETLETTTGLSAETLEKFQALAIRGVENDRRLAELERETAQKLHVEQRDTLLAKAVEEGRILPVHKEYLAGLYDIDPAKCKAMVEASPKRAFREIGSSEPGPEDRPQPRTITDRHGNIVAAVEDSDWLDRRAKQILAEKGKTFDEVTADEYEKALTAAATATR